MLCVLLARIPRENSGSCAIPNITFNEVISRIPKVKTFCVWEVVGLYFTIYLYLRVSPMCSDPLKFEKCPFYLEFLGVCVCGCCVFFFFFFFFLGQFSVVMCPFFLSWSPLIRKAGSAPDVCAYGLKIHGK